jgi:hypothetical protein
VTEVVSVQAEQLRQINSSLAAGFASSEVRNAFQRGPLTPGQARLDEALGLQGITMIRGKPVSRPDHPARRSPMPHRRSGGPLKDSLSPKASPPSELTVLRGPLLREFSRAKERGYRGPPNQWLMGPTAARHIAKLRQRGILDPLWTGRLSLFDRHSPLQWAVSGCSAIQETAVRHGFFGERLRNEGTNVVTLVRQARAVKRLPKQQWPRSRDGGYAWPTFPTLFESWEQLMRGKAPAPVYRSCLGKVPDVKRPTRQVKPGALVRAISTFVCGVRADIAVPREFLGYFEYRWGSLILKRNRVFPAAFARWLANAWKSDITKMFLVYPIRLNDALRRLPDRAPWALSGFVAGNPVGDPHGGRRPDRRLRRAMARQDSVQPRVVTDTTTSSESGSGLRLC